MLPGLTKLQRVFVSRLSRNTRPSWSPAVVLQLSVAAAPAIHSAIAAFLFCGLYNLGTFILLLLFLQSVGRNGYILEDLLVSC